MEHLNLQVLITVPLITAFIGWVTNWAAVKMIFWPRRFVGIGRFGWQGVIPARNEKFANDVAESVGEVLSARDLVDRLDPDWFEAELSERLDAEITTLTGEALEVISPGMWDEMAPQARAMVVAQIRSEVSRVARELFDDVRAVSDESLDLRALVRDLLSGENADRLSELFGRLGRRELRFIVYYGGVFGLLVGVLQALTFGVSGQWWVIPIVGVLVGLGTNWLAIQMIFRPLHPRRYAGVVTYQGMFPRRQPDIAREYGEVAAAEIFTPANLLRVLLEGPSGVRLAASVLRRVTEAIDATRPMVSMLTSVEVTDSQVREVQVLLVTHLGAQLPELRGEFERLVAERLAVAELVEERIAAMPLDDFERLLRGIFEEDEWILIAIGGVLGGLVGLLQASIVLSIG